MKKILFTTAMLGALSTFSLTGCSEQPQAESATKQAPAVTIGAVLPFSGGLEIFGEQAKAGIDLAVQEVNANGGINGAPLQVVYEDNKTDPKTSVEKASKLVRKEKAIAVLGPITSSARNAMTPTLAQLKTPLLYATNYEGGVCNDYVYSFNTVPNQEIEKLIPAVAKEAGNSFYLFGTDYVWPQKMFARAQTEIKNIGGSVSGVAYTPWGVKDYTPAIRKIMASGAKVLVFAVPGVDGTTFIKQAHELGLTKQMDIAFLGFSETYLPALGDTKGMKIWTAVPFISTADSSKAFVDGVKSVNADIAGVSHYAYTHYNAVKAFASALENKDQATAESVLAGLKNLQADGVSINAKNQADLTMYIGKVENGALQEKQALGLQKGDVVCAK